jgi:hypothetical protein
MMSGTIRGSPGWMFGQLIGAVHVLAPPRIRSFIPCSTCPTAPPVCVFTHSHGSGRPQSALYAGQLKLGLILYVGPQPFSISSCRFG